MDGSERSVAASTGASTSLADNSNGMTAGNMLLMEGRVVEMVAPALVLSNLTRIHGCDQCGQKFPSRWALHTHLHSHAGVRPFQCDEPGCGFAFTQKSNLTSHTRGHHGERKHVCDRCDKRFARRDGLLAHSRIHTGTAPFSCDHCGLQFKQKGTLTSHLRVHTGEATFRLCLSGLL